ncbi:hypothetical protein [Nocardia sp. NPDC127526]|uniref:hypothetical protein n=1 Tax=Nocardia sp. NPDC127526 TaxID=3345393 RepID=UPI003636AA47
MVLDIRPTGLPSIRASAQLVAQVTFWSQIAPILENPFQVLCTVFTIVPFDLLHSVVLSQLRPPLALDASTC